MDEVTSDREHEDEDALQRERRARRQAERRVAALETSVSYRLGHAIVLSVTRPLAAIRGLMVFLVRQVQGRLSNETKRRVLTWGDDHLPASVMRRARALSRAATSRSRTGRSRGLTSSAGRLEREAGALLSEDLPVFGYLLFGVEDLELRRLVREVRTASVVHGDHVPLIITDSLAFGHLRAEHVAFEYIPGPGHWHPVDSDERWPDFVRARLTHLRATHAVAQSFIVSGDDRITEAMLSV